MNKREVFDKVAKHLLDQGKQSRDNDIGCAYRGSDGLSCAVGCLIPDDLYDPDMEGKGVWSLMDKFPKIRQLFAGHQSLLTQLQHLHDYELVDNWEGQLNIVRKSLEQA